MCPFCIKSDNVTSFYVLRPHRTINPNQWLNKLWQSDWNCGREENSFKETSGISVTCWDISRFCSYCIIFSPIKSMHCTLYLLCNGYACMGLLMCTKFQTNRNVSLHCMIIGYIYWPSRIGCCTDFRDYFLILISLGLVGLRTYFSTSSFDQSLRQGSGSRWDNSQRQFSGGACIHPHRMFQ